MTTFLIPFFAFVAVMLIFLLFYGVWVNFFDSTNKEKKQRLQAIHDTLHRDGQGKISAQATPKESALETWLRSRFRAFRQLENLVRIARSPLTAGRLIGIMLALFTVVVVLGLFLQTNPLLLLVLAFSIASTPFLWLSLRANKSRQAFGDKLPDAIDYITRALHAGQSLTSAIGMLGKEFPGPIGQEFKTVFDEIAFGIQFKDAFGQLADRVQNNDLNFFVVSLMIQHETGGNLTELLDGLSKTMRERVKLRGKIRTLASEGRSSTWVLCSMPFVFVCILMFVKPDYISILWTTPQGQNLIFIGSGLIACGLFFLNRITQIEV
jgi:tight adherence protein B